MHNKDSLRLLCLNGDRHQYRGPIGFMDPKFKIYCTTTQGMLKNYLYCDIIMQIF